MCTRPPPSLLPSIPPCITHSLHPSLPLSVAAGVTTNTPPHTQGYASLAYAPPKALLGLLRGQLMPQMGEVEPPALAGACVGVWAWLFVWVWVWVWVFVWVWVLMWVWVCGC